MLESGNKVGIAHFETSKFCCHASDGKQRSFSICYPPFSEFWFYCFTNGTPSLIFWRFLTDHHIWSSLAEGLPYLVIALKSTRARKNWAPAANTTDHNFLDRLPSTTTSRTNNYWKFLLSLPKSSKLQKIENFKLNCKFLHFLAKTSSILEYLFYSKTETTIQRPKGKNCKQYINIYWNYRTNC